MGPNGEFIIDYSVYDAVRAGFKRVVFLIAPGMLEDFEAAIGRRVAGSVETAYAFQSLDRLLPPGYEVPRAASGPGVRPTPSSAAARWWTAPSP